MNKVSISPNELFADFSGKKLMDDDMDCVSSITDMQTSSTLISEQACRFSCRDSRCLVRVSLFPIQQFHGCLGN